MKRDDLRLVIPVIYIGGEQHTDLQASRSNRRSSMFYAGIDAHMKSSTIWIVDRKGRRGRSSTVLTSAEGFAGGLGRWVRRGLKAAVEASGITPLDLSTVERSGSESSGGEPESRAVDRRIKKESRSCGRRNPGGAIATGRGARSTSALAGSAPAAY